MQQLLADIDLRELDIHLSHHELAEQARLVAEGKLEAFVMQEDAEFLHTIIIIRQHNLDIVAPGVLHGLVARYPWLSLGHIPAGLSSSWSIQPSPMHRCVRFRESR
jgi:hypothetical protein